jgi:putative component of toxin-antitoxin plasmid stabilization module
MNLSLLHYLTSEGRNPFREWLERARTGKEIVLLLCAGSKATQDADIDRAIMYWQDYIRRTR